MRYIVIILYTIASIGSFVAILNDPGTLYRIVYIFNSIIFGLGAMFEFSRSKRRVI